MTGDAPLRKSKYAYFLFFNLLAPGNNALTLTRAVTAALWTASRLSHAELVPSATLMISLATLSANFTSVLLSALPKTHLIAVLLLNLIPTGTGIGNVIPPPAMPFCCLILTSGATESNTAVKYCIGLRGSRLRGPELGSRACPGLVDLLWGGGAVRRVSRISATVYGGMVSTFVGAW